MPDAGVGPVPARPLRDVARAAFEVAGDAGDGRDDLAFARVVAFRGFGGRRASEAVLVGPDGPVAGSLLGGLADGQILATRGGGLVEVPVGDSEAVAAGLACGGVATVLVTPATAIASVVWHAVATDLRVGIATAVAPGGVSATCAMSEDPVDRSFARHGSLGDPELDRTAQERLQAAIRGGRDVTEITGDPPLQVVLEAYVPTTTLVVVGAAALADALAAQARLLGWSAELVGGFDAAAADLVASLGRNDAVVVLSHDPAVDTPALAASLAAGCYVGALGSRHTQAARRERLTALGLSEEDLGAIHGPVGLDLGSRTPEETAVAVAAEILAHRSGRAATSLRATTGPING